MSFVCKFSYLQCYQILLKSVNIWSSNHKNKGEGTFFETVYNENDYSMYDYPSAIVQTAVEFTLHNILLWNANMKPCSILYATASLMVTAVMIIN